MSKLGNVKGKINKVINFEKSNEDIKVSILVPICNVEKYLNQCLDSIEAQTLNNIEVICINDGSKDSSAKIIEDYAKRDSRFKVIDKMNSGYGDSLNAGLGFASGEYIGIVESDDFIDEDMFETLYKKAVETDADIVKSNFYLYWQNGKDGNGSEINELHEISSEEEDGITVSPIEYKNGKLFGAKASIWSAIYKKSFLDENGICFLPTPGASFQDTSFTFKAFSSTDKFVLIHDAFLHYRQDNASSSVNNLDKKKHCVLDEYKEIFKYVEKNDDENNTMLKISIAAFYDACIWAYERLSQENRYSYLIELSSVFSKLLKKVSSSEIPFGECWWKASGIERIANNPFEYHIWREAERFEQNNGIYDFVNAMRNDDNYLEEKKCISNRNEKPFFSIIIPAYNCEHYITACLESIRGQSFSNFEVICVNDGSSDQTLDILKYYSKVDSRIEIIDSENYGPSHARNLGLKKARGQFILFMDSDDFYNEDALAVLFENSKHKNVDTVSFSANVYPIYNFNEWYEKTLHGVDNEFDKLSANDIIVHPYLGTYIWKVAYRTEFLKQKNLVFDESMKYGEDALFILTVLLESKRTISLNKELYNYRVENTNSLMQTIWKQPNEYAIKQIEILDKTLALLHEYNTNPSKELFEYSCNLIYGAIDGSSGDTRIRVIKQFTKIISKYKLDRYSEEASPSAKGFYEYCLYAISFRRVFRERFSLKRTVRKILPVSRQSYYDYEAKKLDYMNQQLQLLNQLKNEINHLNFELETLKNSNSN